VEGCGSDKVDKPITMQANNLNIFGSTLRGAYIFQSCGLGQFHESNLSRISLFLLKL